jgi:hypothetical protein
LIYEGTFKYNLLIDGEKRYKSGKLIEKINLSKKDKKKLIYRNIRKVYRNRWLEMRAH